MHEHVAADGSLRLLIRLLIRLDLVWGKHGLDHLLYDIQTTGFKKPKKTTRIRNRRHCVRQSVTLLDLLRLVMYDLTGTTVHTRRQRIDRIIAICLAPDAKPSPDRHTM